MQNFRLLVPCSVLPPHLLLDRTPCSLTCLCNPVPSNCRNLRVHRLCLSSVAHTHTPIQTDRKCLLSPANDHFHKEDPLCVCYEQDNVAGFLGSQTLFLFSLTLLNLTLLWGITLGHWTIGSQGPYSLVISFWHFLVCHVISHFSLIPVHLSQWFSNSIFENFLVMLFKMKIPGP